MTSVAESQVPKAGEVAPAFTLPSTSGQPVALAAYRGSKHVLIAFFPLAFTRVCTAELCDFTEAFDRFGASDVEVLPISVDAVPTLAEFKAKYGMKVDLLSDFRRETSRAYGVLLEEPYFANRAYFLVDREGRVRWAHVEENPSYRRTNDEIHAQIERLR